jgi:DNA-binding PadR family transcriptional regulator
MLRHLLLGLLREGHAMHGYALMKDSLRRVGRRLGTGNVYRELDRLAHEGLVRPTRSVAEGDDRRAPYEITEAGRAEFDRWLSSHHLPVRRQYEDELSTRAIFLAGADPSLAEANLRRWREELWLEERRLERQRDLPGAESAGSASDSTVGTMHALETRRLGHLAADLEFLDDLRGTLEVARSTPVRQDQDAMPRPAVARLEARRKVARSRRAPARRQTRTRRSGKGRDQGER